MSEEQIIKSVAYIESVIEDIDTCRDLIKDNKDLIEMYRNTIKRDQDKILKEMKEERDKGLTSYQVMKRIRPKYKYKFINIYKKKYGNK